VQVGPIKLTLKAPGTQRLKLNYGELLSILAFNFNLRRYNEAVLGSGARFTGPTVHFVNEAGSVAPFPF